MNDKQSILVVDDTPANLRLLVGILADQAYMTRPVPNGMLALAAARAEPPDLILLDIMMPNMSGYEVCEQLKADEHTRDIPVIFISAKSEIMDKVKAFSVGGVDYITKPFQAEEVLARVKTHLTLRSLSKCLVQQNAQLQDEIAERKRTEEELRYAKAAADAANQAKSAFLANMSHELRTPLNAIIGFSQLMERGSKLTAEQMENITIIRRSGEHLLTLINDILDLSKVEAGRLTLNESNFDLYQLLDDMEDMFQLRAKERHLQLVFERAPEVPRYLNTDPVRLRQVLINLLNNAIKFTKEGGVALQVLVKDISQEVKPSDIIHLLFEVEDTGPGIAPEELGTLFEAFTQTQTGKTVQEGTGLGLTISRKFAHLMAGDITVTSEVGKGSIFTLDVHLKVAAAADVKESTHTHRIIGLKPNQPHYRILVVDDKWENRQLLIKLLSPLGFEIREAVDGKEAIEIWETFEPQLIWMDMRMPVMDGYEATRRIKATTKGQATAVIALTASTIEDGQTVMLSTGCDDFVRKPFREIFIFETMTKHLGVQYVYEEQSDAQKSTTKESQKDVLTPEVLATLPPELLTALADSIIKANMDTMAETTEVIRTHNAALAEALTHLIDNFEYQSILDLIQKTKRNNN